MNFLALDLGTKLGWASCKAGEHLESGTEVLAKPSEITEQRSRGYDRICDIRVLRLHRWLRAKLSGDFWTVGFEDVQFASTTMQAHLWASLRTVVWLAAHACEAKVMAVPVGTLKKFATGNGAAKKPLMASCLAGLFDFTSNPKPRAGRLLLKNGRPVDDNEVDAVHLLRYIALTRPGTPGKL